MHAPTHTHTHTWSVRNLIFCYPYWKHTIVILWSDEHTNHRHRNRLKFGLVASLSLNLTNQPQNCTLCKFIPNRIQKPVKDEFYDCRVFPLGYNFLCSSLVIPIMFNKKCLWLALPYCNTWTRYKIILQQLHKSNN